ncbi:MAG: hypothetical protein WCO68_02275 [Verrucomicrobiota bacterium]
MQPPWIHLIISCVVSTVLLTFVAAGAARIRFSAPKGLRQVLDILFFSPLLVPAFFIHGTYMNIVYGEAAILLPILYLCGILGFRKVERETLDAARLQGLGMCGTFWRIFVPTAWLWLLGGAGVLLFRLLWVCAELVAHTPHP